MSHRTDYQGPFPGVCADCFKIGLSQKNRHFLDLALRRFGDGIESLT
jgi:hypothetical protein